jgi:hypothetical protein
MHGKESRILWSAKPPADEEQVEGEEEEEEEEEWLRGLFLSIPAVQPVPL